MDEHTSVGQRIAYYRRRRGLTQEVLAGLVGRSTVWLSRIERGERVLDKIADLLTLARVLKVEPADLIGKFSLPPNGGDPLDPPRGIPAIRRSLFSALPDRQPPDVDQLRSQLEEAKQLDGSGSYEALVLLIPDWILAGRAAATQGMPGAWWTLAGLYQVASSCACVVGEGELALVAGDRAMTAARRAEDRLLEATAELHLASALLQQGWLDDAGAVCTNTVDAIAPADDTPLAGWSTAGLCELVGAVAAVRSGDTPAARQFLRHASTAADRVASQPNDYWAPLGAANVGAHGVSVALEAGDATEALHLADVVDVEGLQNAQRRASFLVYVAHAHVLRRDDGAAVAVLLEAERHSAQTLRYHRLARELVGVCLRRERRSRTPGLRGLAERLGVAA
jgi:transcriptional regulator with XRE-family HTH domain